ncbi:DUF4232 domain-containing protein [Streptomyces sp. NPDC005551]|uniref:DUF4232 domain-containing protein n=1 Tax=Streptomyces sp. NPDC005551 TaxID=3364725 RepID=UPI0036B107AA
MIAIRARGARGTALACALALGASGCGLSAELDRERHPQGRPTPTPSRTRTVRPPAPAPISPAPVTPASGRSHAVPVQPRTGCPSSGVRLDTGDEDAAMGLRSMTLTLTNCGDRPYRLNGHPTLRVLDEAGAPLPGVRTVAGTDEVFMAPEDPGPEPLTLAPGESARSGLYWRMAAENGTYLRVGPQRGRAAVTVRAREPLDIGPENVLGTTAWAPTAR